MARFNGCETCSDSLVYMSQQSLAIFLDEIRIYWVCNDGAPLAIWNGLLLRQFCQWSLGDVEGCKYDTSRRLWWQLVVLVTVVSAPCRIDLGNVNYRHFNLFYKCCLIMTFKLQMITDTCPRERRGLGRHWAGVGTSVPTLGRRRSICSAVWWVRLYVF